MDPLTSKLLHRFSVSEIKRQFHKDQLIWESKRYQETPLLAAGDGPIMKLRSWFARFN